MASPVNQHCANCIGTLSFPVSRTAWLRVSVLRRMAEPIWTSSASAKVDAVTKVALRLFAKLLWTLAGS